MIRIATPSDFRFIHAICQRTENQSFIVDVSDDELREDIKNAYTELVIWEVDGQASGFALFCEIGNPSGRIELRRLGLDRVGQGQGSLFLQALVDHGFGSLRAARIWLDVVADNPRAKKIYHRAGFKHEGTLRQNWLRPIGDIVDMHIFGMLRSEW